MTVDQRPLDWGIVRRLYVITRRYARLRNALSAIVVLRAIQLPIVTWAMARVLAGPIAHRDPSGTAIGIAGFLAGAAFTELCFVFRYRFALRLGEAVVHDLRDAVYAHLLRMPLGFFQRSPVGGLVARITSDIDVVRIGVQDVAFVSTVQAGTALISAGLMIYYDWRLFLVVAIMVPGVWTLVRRLRGRLGQAHRDQQESFSRVTATLAESVAGIREIQSFAREKASAGQFAALVRDHATYNMGAARHGAIIQPLLEWNGQLFLSLVLVIGGYQALVGGRAAGGADPVPVSIERPVRRDPEPGQPVQPGAGGDGGRGARVRAAGHPARLGGCAGRRRRRSRRGRRPAGWRRLRLRARPARAQRHRADRRGRDGQSRWSARPAAARARSPAWSRSCTCRRRGGWPSTAATSRACRARRCAGTSPASRRTTFSTRARVADNIRVGRPDASDADVRAAARALDVEALIDALPGGFATEVGEGGTRLSLGQRQVICFARAMIADPRILILDEATSSVDVLTETRMQAALARLRAGRTSFVIAHRLATVRHADEIVVLDHGRVVERGTHAALLAANGAYARLFTRAAGFAAV